MPEAVDDAIVLEVAARADQLRHVRLVAAAVATDVGMDVEEIDDLRVGVNELFGLLVDGGATGSIPRLSIRFSFDNEELVVEGSVESPASPPREVDALASEILAVVVDDYALDEADGRRSARLVKRLPVRV